MAVWSHDLLSSVGKTARMLTFETDFFRPNIQISETFTGTMIRMVIHAKPWRYLPPDAEFTYQLAKASQRKVSKQFNGV